MKRVMCAVGIALGMCLGLASPAAAQGWVLLGERKVNVNAEKDVIPVNVKKTFTKVRLQVIGAPVQIMDLELHFANGNKQDVAIRKNISAGSYTRAIDIKGAARHVTKVRMVYRTKVRGPRRLFKARVRVYGMQGAGEAGPVKKPAETTGEKEPAKAKPVEWVVLGQKKIDFGADKDTIPVTVKEGLFKRIKFRVAGQKAKIWDVKVHFGNGEVFDVQLRKEFAPNSWTRVIDLPGAARVIKKVTLLYKSRVRSPLKRGRATLQLYGARVEGSDRAAEKPVTKPAPAAPSGKWESLGSRKVAWTVDRDTIPVTAAEGRFRQLRVSVTGNKIHLIKMKVVYGNGEETELPINKLIAAGAKSPALDLPGNKRIVKKVVFWYQTPGRRRLRRAQPRATVSLWGMK